MSTASPQDTEQLHLIAFDLASDRRRYRLTRLLEGYGQRVQESVFECWISGEQRATKQPPSSTPRKTASSATHSPQTSPPDAAPMAAHSPSSTRTITSSEP